MKRMPLASHAATMLFCTAGGPETIYALRWFQKAAVYMCARISPVLLSRPLIIMIMLYTYDSTAQKYKEVNGIQFV